MMTRILLVGLLIVVIGFALGYLLGTTGLAGPLILILVVALIGRSPGAIYGAFLGFRDALRR